MSRRPLTRELGGRALAAGLMLVVAAGAAAPARAAQKQKERAAGAKTAAAAAGPSASGSVRLDGKVMTLTNGYLLHAPDAFEAARRNAIVLLVPHPLDAAKLAAARTLHEAYELAPQRVAFEIKPEKKVALSICHEGFGDGRCFSTPVAPFDWKPGVVEEGHVSGSARSFADKEETVLEKFKLYYAFTFDVSGGKSFAARR